MGQDSKFQTVAQAVESDGGVIAFFQALGQIIDAGGVGGLQLIGLPGTTIGPEVGRVAHLLAGYQIERKRAIGIESRDTIEESRVKASDLGQVLRKVLCRQRQTMNAPMIRPKVTIELIATNLVLTFRAIVEAPSRVDEFTNKTSTIPPDTAPRHMARGI